MKGFLIAGAAALLSLALGGCGEKQPVTVYKQGQYQGKPDQQPWNSAQFKGDRAGWESAIKARNESQNEYARVVSK